MKAVGLILLVAALLLFSKLVRAEVQLVQVRSGDHIDFTRLVFNFDTPQAWFVNQTKNVVLVRVQDEKIAYSLEEIFKKIPRRRLLDATLDSETGGVEFKLAPSHIAIAFETEEGVLVIDIVLGTEILPEQTSVLVAPKPKLAAIELPVPELPEMTFVRPEIPVKDPRVRAAQGALVAELGEAIAQGLLTPSQSDFGLENKPVNQQTDIELRAADHINLDAKTAFEVGQRDPSPMVVESPANCLEDEVFRLTPVPVGEEFRDELSRLHRGLSNEVDQVDPQNLDELVRFLLGNGFATETRSILSGYEGVLENADVFHEISEILDWTEPTGTILRSQANCTGKAAIWSILAGNTVFPLAGASRVDFEANFAQMPARVRKLIGPRLVGMLLDRGETTLAKAIRDRVNRAPGPKGVYEPIVDLKFGKDSADSLSYESDLNNSIAAESLVLRLESLESRDQDAGQELLSDADNLAFELRFSPIGQRLRRLQIRAIARRGEINAALATLSHESVVEALDSPTSDALAATVFQLAHTANQADLVEAYFRFGTLIKSGQEFDAAREVVARALLSSGLSQAAWETLQPTLLRASEAIDLLAAQIELARGLPAAALFRVRNQFSREADQMRFEAYAAMQNFEAALNLPPEHIDPDRREKIAWHARDFQGGSVSEPTELSLSALRNALENSADVRKENSDLLASHPRP